MNESKFVLPSTVVTKSDVAQLVNEFERLDSTLTAAEVRSDIGVQSQQTPMMSERLAAFVEQNGIDLKDSRTRGELVKQLRAMKESLPVLHMTFAVEADAESLEKLAEWARTSIDPYAVLDIGLQPGLIAGVYLRTPNHVHDLSLRGILQGRHGALVNDLEALRAGR
jgi:F0F1-type ATP synthase delta subunit